MKSKSKSLQEYYCEAYNLGEDDAKRLHLYDNVYLYHGPKISAQGYYDGFMRKSLDILRLINPPSIIKEWHHNG